MLTEIRTRIAQQLNIPVDSITADSKLVDDLKADSLDIVELVTSLEEEYNIEISDEDIKNIRTVGDVVVSENNTATLSVAGVKDGEAVVVVYLDENGNWQTMKVIARNGQLVFRLPKSTTVMVLTKKAA